MEEQMIQTSKEKGITGRIVLFAFVLFFVVIASVNALMATLAVRTFGGIEAENPYRAGLQFSKDLKAARQQQEREIRVDIAAIQLEDGSTQFRTTVHGIDASTLRQIVARIELRHPADRRYDRELMLAKDGVSFVGKLQVGPGQWNVRISLESNGEQIFRSHNRMMLQ
jgi:nitrogen fixation protein FixH